MWSRDEGTAVVRDVTRCTDTSRWPRQKMTFRSNHLRLYQDDVMYEMVNPKEIRRGCVPWCCYAAEALVCRFVADQYIVGYVEAGLSTLIIMVAVFTLYTLTMPSTKNWKVSANGEYFIVNALQSLVLCNSYASRARCSTRQSRGTTSTSSSPRSGRADVCLLRRLWERFAAGSALPRR